MSISFDQIPPEREQAYLQNAAEAFREATDPVVEIIGKAVVADAEDIVAGKPSTLGPNFEAQRLVEADSKAPKLVDEAEKYLHKVASSKSDPSIPSQTDVFKSLNATGYNDSTHGSLKVGYGHEAISANKLTDRELKDLEQLDTPSTDAAQS